MPGPPPKPNRARRNKTLMSAEFDTHYLEPFKQPKLSQLFPGTINPLDDREGVEEDERRFSSLARRLWRSLRDYPTTSALQEVQWVLLAQALTQWDVGMKGGPGALNHLKEARLVFSSYGLTPHDLLRLRINIADASTKEDDAVKRRRKADKRRPSFNYGAVVDMGAGKDE